MKRIVGVITLVILLAVGAHWMQSPGEESSAPVAEQAAEPANERAPAGKHIEGTVAAIADPELHAVAQAIHEAPELSKQGMKVKRVFTDEESGKVLMEIGMKEETVREGASLDITPSTEQREALLARMNGGVMPELGDADHEAIAEFRKRMESPEAGR